MSEPVIFNADDLALLISEHPFAPQFLAVKIADAHDAILADVAAKARTARADLYEQVLHAFAPVTTALDEAPQRVAAPAVRAVQEILSAISDPLGEDVGLCEFCEERVFLLGGNDPNDDSESAGDLGWVHRTCMDKQRKDSPEAFRATDEGDDD